VQSGEDRSQSLRRREAFDGALDSGEDRPAGGDRSNFQAIARATGPQSAWGGKMVYGLNGQPEWGFDLRIDRGGKVARFAEVDERGMRR
jgi:hypothetical protein